jgi:outer membrane protein OmpA-like peptidoglycan-associated protein
LGSDVELLNLSTTDVVSRLRSDEQTGEYLTCLPSGENYALNVAKPGYLFYSENFSLKDLTDVTKPFRLDVPLQPIKIGASVVLKNIFFETDSYTLRPESNVELQKLIDFLQKNPGVQIEIGGHTDNVGSKEYNQNLSHNRAMAVYNYLVERSIAKNRLTYKGYSFDKPIAGNDSPEGRALNRRTEFIITGVK